MGLPGRRDRERRRSDTRTVMCPVCQDETEVTVQKRDTIRRITGVDGVVNELDTEFEKTPEDAFTSKTSDKCCSCECSLSVLKSYAPR